MQLLKRLWPSLSMWHGGFTGAFAVSIYHLDTVGMFLFGVMSLYTLALSFVRAFEEAERHAK